jgi:predicted ATPase
MIEKLHIEAFKCFEKESLEFRNLTILTGTNGSGKSSVIQAILQLSLYLNQDFSSPLLQYLEFISNFDETVNFNMDEDEYKLGLDAFENEITLSFSRKDGGWSFIGDMGEKTSYSKGNLIFLSGDRIGPQDIYNKNINPLDRFGIYGEYAISFLEKARREKYQVIDELVQGERKFLDSQVNYWLNNILETEIKTEESDSHNQIKASF